MQSISNNKDGILPYQDVLTSIARGIITTDFPGGICKTQIQPASLDLRLGEVAYRLRASFLPGAGRTLSDYLNLAHAPLLMHKMDITQGAVLETNCVYLVPLCESLTLPIDMSAHANPKSSTGRLDVFTRVISDGAQAFDRIPAGYKGLLYLEIAPRTFSVKVRTGDSLAQLRLRRGAPKIERSQTISVDLQTGLDRHASSGGETLIGWQAIPHSGLVDFTGIAKHDAREYWRPLYAHREGLVLDPERFYILMSKESICVADNEAAEMAPIAPEIGEFRAHYAGFFDPGFGLAKAGGEGARAVLEIRGRDVPFVLTHGQAIARLDFESLCAPTEALYGNLQTQTPSHYQGQGLRLSKHFYLPQN